MRLFILFVLVFILWVRTDKLEDHHNASVIEHAELREEMEVELIKLKRDYCELLEKTGNGACRSNVVTRSK